MLSTPFGNDSKDTPPDQSFCMWSRDLRPIRSGQGVWLRLGAGRGYGGNFVHSHPRRKRFDRFHSKLYDRWKASGQPLSVEALEEFILGRLAYWMPSQQAWTVVPFWSRHAALGCAFIYVCERDAEESKKPQVQEG